MQFGPSVKVCKPLIVTRIVNALGERFFCVDDSSAAGLPSEVTRYSWAVVAAAPDTVLDVAPDVTSSGSRLPFFSFHASFGDTGGIGECECFGSKAAFDGS